MVVLHIVYTPSPPLINILDNKIDMTLKPSKLANQMERGF